MNGLPYCIWRAFAGYANTRQREPTVCVVEKSERRAEEEEPDIVLWVISGCDQCLKY